MESDHYKTFSIIFGSLSFVITVSGFPTLYTLTQVLLSPKLTPDILSKKDYSNQFVSITGVNQSQNSFLNQTDKKEQVVYSRVKTKFDVLGLSARNMHNKSVQYSSFELLSGSKPVTVIPAYHSKIQAPTIYEKYNTDLSAPDSIFYSIIGLILSPLIPFLGVTIKLGEKVTEKALKNNSFTTVCGKLKNDGDCFSIVPEFIAPSLSHIYDYLFKKSVVVLLGSFIFGGLSLITLYLSKSREKQLKESQNRLSGPLNLKCLNCENFCDTYFEPCLEIVLCQVCGSNLSTCPKCKKDITGRVSFHIS